MTVHNHGSAAYDLPIGTPVRAFPGTRDSEPLVTRTRSEVWRTDAGDEVVAVEGYAGGIALTHIDVIERAQRAGFFPEDDALASMTNVLMNAWAKAEPDHGVTKHPASYVASFVDMAKAALASGLIPVPQPDDNTIDRAVEVLDLHASGYSEVGFVCHGCDHVYFERPAGACMDPDLDWLGRAIQRHRAEVLVAALASPAREPGRSETDVVTTVEELDALPVGSVVLDRIAKVFERHDRSRDFGDDRWCWALTGVTGFWSAMQVDLPATVIHRAAQVTDTEGGE